MLELHEDEAGLSSVPTLSLMWALEGKQPLVNTATRSRQKVTLFGAVDEERQQRYLMVSEKGNTDTYLSFLRHLDRVIPSQTAILMVVDNVPFHHSRRLKAEFENSRFHFVYQAPYSPHLNKQEDEWRAMRREVTHNTFYPAFEQELESVEAHFLSLGAVCFKP